MSYLVFKHLHLTCVGLSAALFLVRGLLMLWRSEALRARWARVLSHVVDTVLLSAAIGMLVVGRVNPLDQPWLLAKIGALPVYVGLGTVALKRGRTRGIRLAAWLAALAVLLYIVSVALTKQVWPL
ncbi:SirB2 family protein [Sphaerotilus sp.]|uniref:SirB2 family protein n=1 Tax=Sphaerotilus sp. TaxID=2093942 RepID=UPI0034E2F139